MSFSKAGTGRQSVRIATNSTSMSKDSSSRKQFKENMMQYAKLAPSTTSNYSSKGSFVSFSGAETKQRKQLAKTQNVAILPINLTQSSGGEDSRRPMKEVQNLRHRRSVDYRDSSDTQNLSQSKAVDDISDSTLPAKSYKVKPLTLDLLSLCF